MCVCFVSLQSFGNHEFDRNIDGLVEPFLKKIDFPILSANLDASKEPPMQGTYNKSTVLERQGRKIGIVSYITPDTKDISHPGNHPVHHHALTQRSRFGRFVQWSMARTPGGAFHEPILTLRPSQVVL